MERWRVHKFGGSSVADAACMERVASILEADPRRRLSVVLSACRGVTDALLGLVSAAEQQGADVSERLAVIRQRHVDIADTLLHADARRRIHRAARQGLRDVHGALETVRLIRSAPAAVRDLVVGFGEIWSTRLFTRVPLGARPAARSRPLARCAGRDSGRVGSARSGCALAGVPGERSDAPSSPQPTRR